MSLFCTAVERASYRVHKLFGTGGVPTSLTFIVLAVADGLFGLYGSERREELFTGAPYPVSVDVKQHERKGERQVAWLLVGWV